VVFQKINPANSVISEMAGIGGWTGSGPAIGKHRRVRPDAAEKGR
jgi:hypothetical protein